MTKVSNDYFEAYGYPAENHDKKITDVSNKAYAPKSSNGQTNTGPITASIQCGNIVEWETTLQMSAETQGLDTGIQTMSSDLNVIRWGTNEMHAQWTDRTDRLDHSELRQCNISQHIGLRHT